MTPTPRYALELLANNAGNVQRVNESLLISDAFLGGGRAESRVILAEPGSPDEGDLYLLPASGSLTGTAWSTFTNGNLALYLNAAWLEITVGVTLEGCSLFVVAEAARISYFGSSRGWVEVGLSVEAGIGANGTTQGAGTLISQRANEVDTANPSNVAVTLEAGIAGEFIMLANVSGQTLSVFPASGEAIDSLATDAAFSLPNGSNMQLFCPLAGQWYAILSA